MSAQRLERRATTTDLATLEAVQRRVLAWGYCVPTGLERVTTFSRLLPKWLGIWRPPLLGSSFLPSKFTNRSRVS